MPKIWPVLSQAFTGLFVRLGIQAVPSGQQWFLSDTIIPVAMVDTDVTLVSVSVPTTKTFVTEGEFTNSADGILLADTGALAAGVYEVQTLVGCSESNTCGARLQHRDAANAATLWQGLYILRQNGGAIVDSTVVKAIVANERFRLIQFGAIGVASTIQSSILLAKVG